MAYPTVTYTLANGETADATKLNTNWSDLIAGMSDGTKDFSINALTVAGAATLNGSVALGNATSDDLAANGYWTTNLIPKTTAVYGLGSTSLRWNALYVSGTVGLDGAVTINSSAADVDFRVAGQLFSNVVYVDASTSRCGFGTSSPNAQVTINGALSVLNSAEFGATSTAVNNLSAGNINYYRRSQSPGTTATVVINGFVSGVTGQVMYMANVNNDGKSLILVHAAGTGNQDIYTPDGTNITLAGLGGLITLIYDSGAGGWFASGGAP